LCIYNHALKRATGLRRCWRSRKLLTENIDGRSSIQPNQQQPQQILWGCSHFDVGIGIFLEISSIDLGPEDQAPERSVCLIQFPIHPSLHLIRCVRDRRIVVFWPIQIFRVSHALDGYDRAHESIICSHHCFVRLGKYQSLRAVAGTLLPDAGAGYAPFAHLSGAP